MGVLGPFRIAVCGLWDRLELQCGGPGTFRIAVWGSWDPLELQCGGPGTL